MRESDRLATSLTERFGLPLGAEAFIDAGTRRYRVYPLEIAPTQGFAVEVLIGWRSVEARFVPGSFATSLVTAMQLATSQQRAVFRAFAHAIAADGATLSFCVNGKAIDPLTELGWPLHWRSIALRLERTPIEAVSSDPQASRSLAETWGGRMLGLALALLPVEAELASEVEGGAVHGQSTRHERSSLNRAACIELHGARCKVCHLDFSERYGPIGHGFIEVHHLEPVSQIPSGTPIDPAKDLVPLCPNCHSMAHRREPPLGVQELRDLLR